VYSNSTNNNDEHSIDNAHVHTSQSYMRALNKRKQLTNTNYKSTTANIIDLSNICTYEIKRIFSMSISVS